MSFYTGAKGKGREKEEVIFSTSKSTTFEADKVYFHPDFDAFTNMADLAMVKLKTMYKVSEEPMRLPFLSPAHLFNHVTKYKQAFNVWMADIDVNNTVRSVTTNAPSLGYSPTDCPKRKGVK